MASLKTQSKLQRGLSLLIAVAFFCSLTGCYKMEWKHHNDQYLGDLKQDLSECHQFKTTPTALKRPPYNTGDPKRVEDLNLMNESNFLLLQEDALFPYCMDYKGYQGERVISMAGGILIVAAIVGGVVVLSGAKAVISLGQDGQFF